MPDDRHPSKIYRLWLINRRVPIGMSATGTIIFVILASFAYLDGFLSLDRLTQTRMVNAFQELNGVHPGG